jgi:hypothetical protein
VPSANCPTMSSEFGESTKVADEDDLTALEKFGNQFYNGVCGVLYGLANVSCSAHGETRLNLFSFFFFLLS